MRERRPAALPLGRIFAVPAPIAALTLAGLVVALLGEGIEDVLAWAALALPPAVIAWALGFRRA